MSEVVLPPRGTPMSSEALQEMLSAGPSIEQSPFEDEPLPSVSPLVEPELIVRPEPAAPVTQPVLQSDGPDELTRKLMILPDEREKALLRRKFPGIELKVIPFPYSAPNGKMQCYIIRPLTFAQWRSCEVTAQKISESKPGVPGEEILAEKVVSASLVWPQIAEQELMVERAGLVPTLYGVIQQLCLFFNPDTIARMAFTL